MKEYKFSWTNDHLLDLLWIETTWWKYGEEVLKVTMEVAEDVFSILAPKYLEWTGNRGKIFRLAQLLVLFKIHWVLDFSNNPINNFETEQEIKYLDVDIPFLRKKLEEQWAQLEFEGTVEDIYYDYPTQTLDKWKKSFRLRIKIDKATGEQQIFYTIKRKDKEAEKATWLRTSKEKELKVNLPSLFLDFILREWLVPIRKKKKTRVSYLLIIDWKKIKFDIDNYENPEIPPILEIEVEGSKILDLVPNELWLSQYKTTTEGSRWLFKRYWVEQKKW